MSYDKAAVGKEVKLIRDYLDWVESPDGVARSEDKGYGPGAILTDCMAMLLHAPAEHGIPVSPERVAYFGLLRYMAENGTDSQQWKSFHRAMNELEKAWNSARS